MKKSIEQLKLDLISPKSQIVLFDRNGKLLKSCNTLLKIESSRSVYRQFNFLLSIEDVIKDLNTEPLIFELIEWEEQNQGLYYISFELNEDQLIQWTIIDKSDEKQQISSVQQSRNDSAIGEELAGLREKYLQSEKDFLEFRNAELQRIQEFKERFFAEVSHEIRTPLNSITGLVKLLEWSEPEEHYEYLHALKSTSEHLNHIINDVLDLSKLEEGKLVLEDSAFKLKEIIGAIIKGFTMVAREKKIQLTADIDLSIPEVIISDPVRFSQVLYNLIGNSVKFTHEGGITVKIQLLEQDGDDFILGVHVLDTGIGMSKESIQKILEPYAQVEGQSNSTYGGTGLGMGVAHQLIQAFGGELKIESELKKGTTIGFELRVQKGNHIQYSVEDHYDPAVYADVSKYKLLFAEDDEMSLLVMKERSLKWNLNSTFVTDVQSLKNELNQNSFDLLISDLHLDDLAIPILEDLRKSDRQNAQIPIIFISGDSQDLHPELEKLDNWSYLVKPVNPRALSLKMRNMLGIKSNNQLEEVDLSQLKRSVPDSPEFLIELIDTILENLPKDLQSMSQALENKDLDQAKKALHKMKPSITYLGIASISKDRDRLHDALLNGQDILDEIQIFKSRVNLALEDLSQKKLTISS